MKRIFNSLSKRHKRSGEVNKKDSSKRDSKGKERLQNNSNLTLSQMVFQSKHFDYIVRNLMTCPITLDANAKRQFIQWAKKRKPLMMQNDLVTEESKALARLAAKARLTMVISLFELLFQENSEKKVILKLVTLERYNEHSKRPDSWIPTDIRQQLLSMNYWHRWFFPLADDVLKPNELKNFAKTIIDALLEASKWSIILDSLKHGSDIIDYDGKRSEYGVYRLEWDKLPETLKKSLNKKSYITQYKQIVKALEKYEKLLGRKLSEKNYGNYPGYVSVEKLVAKTLTIANALSTAKSSQAQLESAFKALDIVAVRDDCVHLFMQMMLSVDLQTNKNDNPEYFANRLKTFLAGEKGTLPENYLAPRQLAETYFKQSDKDRLKKIAALTEKLVSFGFYGIDNQFKNEFLTLLDSCFNTNGILDAGLLEQALLYYLREDCIPEGFISLRSAVHVQDKVKKEKLILQLLAKGIFYIKETDVNITSLIGEHDNLVNKIEQGKLNSPGIPCLRDIIDKLWQTHAIKAINKQELISLFNSKGLIYFNGAQIQAMDLFLTVWLRQHLDVEPNDLNILSDDLDAFQEGIYEIKGYRSIQSLIVEFLLDKGWYDYRVVDNLARHFVRLNWYNIRECDVQTIQNVLSVICDYMSIETKGNALPVPGYVDNKWHDTFHQSLRMILGTPEIFNQEAVCARILNYQAYMQAPSLFVPMRSILEPYQEKTGIGMNLFSFFRDYGLVFIRDEFAQQIIFMLSGCTGSNNGQDPALQSPRTQKAFDTDKLKKNLNLLVDGVFLPTPKSGLLSAAHAAKTISQNKSRLILALILKQGYLYIPEDFINERYHEMQEQGIDDNSVVDYFKAELQCYDNSKALDKMPESRNPDIKRSSSHRALKKLSTVSNSMRNLNLSPRSARKAKKGTPSPHSPVSFLKELTPGSSSIRMPEATKSYDSNRPNTPNGN